MFVLLSMNKGYSLSYKTTMKTIHEVGCFAGMAIERNSTSGAIIIQPDIANALAS